MLSRIGASYVGLLVDGAPLLKELAGKVTEVLCSCAIGMLAVQGPAIISLHRETGMHAMSRAVLLRTRLDVAIVLEVLYAVDHVVALCYPCHIEIADRLVCRCPERCCKATLAHARRRCDHKHTAILALDVCADLPLDIIANLCQLL